MIKTAVNKGNLIVPSSELARENGRKGGYATAKKNREKKAFRESFETILSMPLKDGKSADIEEIQNYAAMKGKNVTVQEVIAISILQKAMKGDVRAAEYIRDTIGQKPKEVVENLNPDIVIDLSGWDNED